MREEHELEESGYGFVLKVREIMYFWFIDSIPYFVFHDDPTDDVFNVYLVSHHCQLNSLLLLLCHCGAVS